MKRAALWLLLLAAGSATAQVGDVPSHTPGMDESSASASTVYDVDEDRDGRADRLLILEQSDSLA